MYKFRFTNLVFVVSLFIICGLLIRWEHGGSGDSLVSNAYNGLSAHGNMVTTIRGETRYVKGVAGVTMWENLYLRDGIYYVISSNPDQIPSIDYVMAGPPQGRRHPPATEDRWRVISPREAPEVLGNAAIRKSGISIFFNDAKGPEVGSFLNHYFHFVAEVFLAGWRVITSSYGIGHLPHRIIFRTSPDDWRDHAGLSAWFQQTVLPNTIIEDGPIWQDRINSGLTFVFDKLAMVDRFAAHNAGGSNVRTWNKMTMDLVDLPVGKTWMDPLRTNMMNYVKSQGCDLSRKQKDVPIVTYINRQRTKRRMRESDGAALDSELAKLADKGEIELYNLFFEDIPRHTQFCLVLKSDIMIGVHGNGLTHQMWMKSGSAVLEIMDVGGFAMDYAFVANVMKHEYYAIHNNTIFAESEWIQPDGRPMYQGEHFHSNQIDLHAPFLAGVVSKLARARRSRS